MAEGIRLVVLGKQGAGKGTQCARLSRLYTVPHISTGDILRASVKQKTPLGIQAQESMDRGELVPDPVMIGIVKERLDQSDVVIRGFLLDGFPRTVAQGEALYELLGPEGLDAVVDITVPTEVVVRRISGRLICADCGTTYHEDSPPARPWACDVCGGPITKRADDNEEAVRRRLNLYEEQTSPLLAWYLEKGLLLSVDGLGEPDEVFERIKIALVARTGRSV